MRMGAACAGLPQPRAGLGWRGAGHDGVGAVSYCDPDQAGKSVTFPNGGLRKRGSPACVTRHGKSGDPSEGPAGTARLEPAGYPAPPERKQQNSEPEFELHMPDGTPIRVVEMSPSGTPLLAVNWTDADGDTISYRLDPAFDIITLTQGGAPNSAMPHTNATGAAPGAYSFKIAANGGTEDEWAGCAVLMAEGDT